MAILACDVAVLGTSLGGLISAAYLSRQGLRVVVLEEAAQAKRPAPLREPFAISGFGPGGALRPVLRELGLPLRQQAAFEPEASLGQIERGGQSFALPGEREGRILALAAAGGLEPSDASAWLSACEVAAQRLRDAFWALPYRPRGLGWWLGRDPARTTRDVPAPPAPLLPLLAPLLDAAQPLESSGGAAAARLPALALASLWSGSQRLRGADRFGALLRARLRARHGEIHATDALGLRPSASEFVVALPGGSFRARALCVAAPLEPLRHTLAESEGAPEWWPAAPCPVRCPTRLFRVDPAYLSEQPSPRLVRSEAGGASVCFQRFADEAPGGGEWLRASGPGAEALSSLNPLGRRSPFLRTSVAPAEAGPAPRWDLSAAEIRLHHSPRLRAPLHLPVIQVGPERAAGLGFEGELLQARRAALQLARRLGIRRALA